MRERARGFGRSFSFGLIYIEAWLSLVERYVRDVEAAGSNPVASIEKRISDLGILFFSVFRYFSEGRRAKTALGLFLGAAWVRHAYPAPGRAGSNPVASIGKVRIFGSDILSFFVFRCLQ